MQIKARNLNGNLASAFVLGLIQILCFWPIMGKVGFYLDDWATMAYLHFAPRNQGLIEFLKYYLLNDSRVQNRPLEVLHFGLLHWIAGGNPLHFHLFNLGLEILAASLAYQIFVRISGERALSLIAALVFLLHPGHDSTHYWVICSSVTLSMLLYLVSLHFSLAFVDSQTNHGTSLSGLRPGLCAVLAALFFLLSLLNYETLIPLAAINVLLVVALTKQNQPQGWFNALKQGLVIAAALGLAIGLLLCYLKFFMPLLGNGYVHHAQFNWGVMSSTLARGFELNLPVALGAFVLEQVANVHTSLNRSEWLRLGAIVLLAGGGAFGLRQLDIRAKASDSNAIAMPKTHSLPAASLIAIGAIGLVASYSVFGLSSDYEPTYYTMVNRINAGGTLASAIGLLGFLKLVPYWQGPHANKISSFILVLLTACLVACFTLTNFALARPWLVSWETQSTIRKNILAQKNILGKGPTLLLVNCPRYVMWSPVFDGVWDFSNMLRIALNDFDVNANVVSERLSIDRDSIKDISRGFECGRYPFSKLRLVIAPQAELISAPDAKHFIQIVSLRGMGFGFPAKGLDQWRDQLKKVGQ